MTEIKINKYINMNKNAEGTNEKATPSLYIVTP
jgi:hypothetical protein